MTENNSLYGKLVYVNASKAPVKEKDYSEACDFIAVLKNLHLWVANNKGSII